MVLQKMNFIMKFKIKVIMLTIYEFNRGINFWNSKPNWPNDLHNAFYISLQKALHKNWEIENPFNEELIRIIINPLQTWVAIRPKPQNYIIENYLKSIDILNKIWRKDIVPVREGDITTIDYSSLETFIETVKNIKGVNSYVFTSKFCHFLIPNIFPVYDNTALAGINNNYKEYYENFRSEWNNTDGDVKNQLITAIENKIKSTGGDVLNNYPYQTKAVEICLIGRQHNH